MCRWVGEKGWRWGGSNLDKGEGRSRAKRLRFMLHLIFNVVFHALLLVDLLLPLHVEKDSSRHSNSDGALRFGLKEET